MSGITFNTQLERDQQLVVIGASQGKDSALSDVSNSEAALQMRRAAALSHHHRQIWVKDAHGGMYRKADTQTSSITATPPLGYEVVKRGPTTNIVGNHMTQAAIDLVQAELEYVEAPLWLLEPTEPLPKATTDQHMEIRDPLEICHKEQDECELDALIVHQRVGQAGGNGPPDMASLRKEARLLRSSITASHPCPNHGSLSHN